jgi:hypothetical protein
VAAGIRPAADLGVTDGSASRGGGAPEVESRQEPAERIRLGEGMLVVTSACSGGALCRQIEDGPAASSAPWRRHAAAQRTGKLGRRSARAHKAGRAQL